MYQAITHGRAEPTGGFWGEKRALMRTTTLQAVYDRFRDTGRFAALDFSWTEGAPNKPHIFFDSDVAKWIESAAYLLRDGRDPAIEGVIDELVDKIALRQRADGYFNSTFDLLYPYKRFQHYTDHELYCLGHLLEAAVAYARATGKTRLFALLDKYVDLVDRVFRVEHSAAFDTPGHEEIELALYKAWEFTGDEKYLTLMRYFIDTRGKSERDQTYDFFGDNLYSQAHLPVREQTTAEGHSVRACYLYSAMADLARHDNDSGLIQACEAIYRNIANKRMYVTGGVGSSHMGESFTIDYDLMNRTAYAETCAAIALAMFCHRMTLLSPRGAYADTAELALYNGMLPGLSLDGRAFFYENPLEMHPELLKVNARFREREHMPIATRREVFSCSCCPPNVTRVIADIASYALTESPSELLVHQYMSLRAQTRFGALRMETAYPYDGLITVAPPPGAYTLRLRVPAWSGDYTLHINGEACAATPADGYVSLTRDWRAGDSVTLALDMRVRRVAGHPALHEDCGRVAVMKGPLAYCLEEADNGKNLKDIALPAACAWETLQDEQLGVPALHTIGYRRDWTDDMPLYQDVEAEQWRALPVKLIPYFAWANRGENEMQVWVLRKPE